MIHIEWLIFAHYIGDIALQSNWQAQNKGKLWYVMLSHCIIWAACVCVALQFLGVYALWKAVFLVLGHALSDTWKSRQPLTPEHWWKIYPDQVWHITQVVFVGLM